MQDSISVFTIIHTGLFGEVSANLRAVRYSRDDSDLVIRFFYDGEIQEADVASVDTVTAEVKEHFPDWNIVTEVVRLDMPEPLPVDQHAFGVYMRRERSFDSYARLI